MEYKPSFVDQLDVDYISHHGIKGMHWGVRRYENYDGTLTGAGKKRYSLNPIRRYFQKRRDAEKAKEEARINAMSPSEKKHYFTQKAIDNARTDYMDDFDNTPDGKKLLKQYWHRQEDLDWDRYDNDEAYYKKCNDALEKAEQAYFYNMGDYMVKRLVKEHGYDEVESYANSKGYPNGKTLEERFGKDLQNKHGL